MSGLTITIGKKTLDAELYLNSAPVTCRTVLKRLPLHAQLVAARWSGPLCLIQKLDWRNLVLEHPISMLSPGDIVFHPEHRDVAIAYGPTQFIEQTRSVYVTLFGRVTDGLTALVEVAAHLRKSGAVDCIWQIK